MHDGLLQQPVRPAVCLLRAHGALPDHLRQKHTAQQPRVVDRKRHAVRLCKMSLRSGKVGRGKRGVAAFKPYGRKVIGVGYHFGTLGRG